MTEAENALHLSPLDPQKYYFEMMLANSYLAMGRLDEAVALCRSSLAKNRYHLPTLRAMLIAQYELGQEKAARETYELILALQPDLTLTKYTAAGSHSRLRQRGAKVFAELGLRQH